MEEDGKWITTKNGNRVFIKNTNQFMNNKIKEVFNHNDEDYYYHSTNSNLINNIKQVGLIPNTDVGNEMGLFFGENNERKSNSVYGDVELRFLKSKLKSKNRYIGNYYTTDKIDARDIEIKDNQTNKWSRLI